jgi:phosphatidylglycerophosphate synthase
VAAAAYAYTVSPDMSAAPASDSRATLAALFSAFAVFFYSTLDNMDGKQARRTGSSSPLGLLFDHGCDAVNAGLIGFLSLALHLGSGPHTWTTLALWIIPTSAFFVNTWEEFHTGTLVLPIVNGANEGLLLAFGALFSTAAYGQGIWGRTHTTSPWTAWAVAPVVDACRWAAHQDLAYGGAAVASSPVAYWSQWSAGLASAAAPAPSNLEVFLALAAVAGLVTVLGQVANVATVEKKAGGWPAVQRALLRLAPYLLLVVAVCLWLHVPSTAAVVQTHWFAFYLAAGSLFGDMSTKLMVSHVCGMEYKPRFWSTALLAITPVLQIVR